MANYCNKKLDALAAPHSLALRVRPASGHRGPDGLRAGRGFHARGALEKIGVLVDEKRGCEVTYVRTREGFEVDFLARSPEGEWLLLQVCADLSDAATREREVRALLSATTDYPHATPLLISLDAIPPQPELPHLLRWQPAAAWLLGCHY